MWRDSYFRHQTSVANKTATCSQCPTGLMKYIELAEFPSIPVRFHVDRTSSPVNSSGVVQVHYWTVTPPSSIDPSLRFWIADINPGGGSFLFQPTPGKRFLSLFKRNSGNSNFFSCVCFKYIPESRTFVPQTFN